jgi:Asp-tRNA(Asn)/Glu-tRNA(Gln) amidotransferase A subunit family amidase
MRSWGIGLKFMRAKKTALVFAFLLVPLADCAPDHSFHLMETSIADIHKALQAGTLTCHDLVQQYLDRIHACDQQGPAIKSMLCLNPASLEQADALDQDFRRTHKLKPLGCIPMVLKDNFDNADMPTTAGALTLKRAQPEKDAFAVKQLREAGALILGKANLQEFASGGISVSSLGGQVKNPLEKFFATAQSYEDGPNSTDYKDRRMRMEEVRIEVANLMAKNQLDALVYPHQKCLVLPIGATFQKDRNAVIAALAGFPAVEVPAGFSTPTTDAPIGVPVGMELLGRAWAEPELIRLAFGFEQATHLRKPPVSTPALPAP